MKCTFGLCDLLCHCPIKSSIIIEGSAKVSILVPCFNFIWAKLPFRYVSDLAPRENDHFGFTSVNC